MSINEGKKIKKNKELNYPTMILNTSTDPIYENKINLKTDNKEKDFSINYINIIENPPEFLERRKKNVSKLSPEKQMKYSKEKKSELNNVTLFQNSWDNRMIEWFQADERLIFVAKNELDCDRWICLLRFLLEFQNFVLSNQSHFSHDNI